MSGSSRSFRSSRALQADGLRVGRPAAAPRWTMELRRAVIDPAPARGRGCSAPLRALALTTALTAVCAVWSPLSVETAGAVAGTVATSRPQVSRVAGTAVPGRPAEPSTATVPFPVVPTLTGAVPEQRVVIGHSVRGRALVAYHRTGTGPVRRTALVIGQWHGDEDTGPRVVAMMRALSVPAGLDLWLVPTANPDGDVRNRRGNAHSVDLNRNFPYRWRAGHRGTAEYPGPWAGSEPETRALMALVRRIRPDLTVSFHSPLYGVDAYGEKHADLVLALARATGYPVRSFSCSGSCHGTFTQFLNHAVAGAAITFEFARTTSAARRARVAAGVLRVLATC